MQTLSLVKLSYFSMPEDIRCEYDQVVARKPNFKQCCKDMFNFFRLPIESRKPSDSLETCRIAAENGHLDCLWLARENGWPWDESVAEAAAGNGNLNCLIYLHTKGCPWDSSTCSSAAAGGHLSCLKYAHEEQCAWDEDTCSSAALFCKWSCLAYAHENRCPWDWNRCFPCHEVFQD